MRQRVIRLTELSDCVICTGQLIEPHVLKPFATYLVPRDPALDQASGYVEGTVEFFASEGAALREHELCVAAAQRRLGRLA